MSSPSNPLTGGSWGNTPSQQGTTGGTSSILQTPWLSQPPNTNPGGYGNPTGANEINRNVGLTNIQAGQMKNQLAPAFAQLMQQYGGQAGNFFTNLMNLGSPYYQQQQQAGFTQGVQQNQNAGAQAKQQLQSQGYGYGPSGANAAMIGGMAQQGSQNLAEQYLQNLFQNEQMQGAGAQGLAGLAQTFNPTQLLGGTAAGANIQPSSNFFQDFNSIASSLSGAGGQTASGAGVSL
jgi:hypothetical protein